MIIPYHVPFLDGNNTWSGTDTFNNPVTVGSTLGVTGNATIPSIIGGSAAGSTVNIKGTSSGSPSGDSVTVQGSNITLRSLTGTSNINIGVANSIGGQLTFASPAGGSIVLQPTGVSSVSGSIVIPNPVVSDTMVTQNVAQTLTNKTISVATNTFNFTPITASLPNDILLNNTANYFDGPSIAQGSTGTWWVSGTVTITDTSAANIICKLWDGTTVIASSGSVTVGASGIVAVSLSGFLTAPAGNLRISCKDGTNATGKIIFNGSGNSKDSTISAFRIA